MPKVPESELPFVSVIVPVFNGERTLPSVFAALDAQNYPQSRFEVLVVDNGSRDNTAAMVNASPWTLISSPARSVGGTRNIGAQQAKGVVLAFLDSDCIPAPDWIEAGVRSLAQQRCITGAPYLQPEARTWIHDAWFSQRGRGRRPVKLINSGNLFVLRDDFFAIGGFNENLQSGEDSEFCLRAQSVMAVIADDSIKVVHLGDPSTLAEFCRREIWYGIGALGSAKQSIIDKPLLATLVFALSLLLQLVGVFFSLLSPNNDGGSVFAHGPRLLTLGTSGVIAVILGTVFYRALQYRNWQQLPRLIFLYYLYYICRTFALYYAVTGQRYYHRR